MSLAICGVSNSWGLGSHLNAGGLKFMLLEELFTYLGTVYLFGGGDGERDSK